MGILGKIFAWGTWWNGATVSTKIMGGLTGEQVGTDHQGNKYYCAKKRLPDGRERRWVIYNGANDASRVPAEWHGWLHGTYDGVPESHLPPPHIWEAEYTPNATGTSARYLPAGATGSRAAASGDYESWVPEG